MGHVVSRLLKGLIMFAGIPDTCDEGRNMKEIVSKSFEMCKKLKAIESFLKTSKTL
jgi:hypothetical protein